MNMLTGNTPQDRHTEVIATYIENAMRSKRGTEFPVEECSKCFIDLYPSDKYVERYPKVFCMDCAPKCTWQGCTAPIHAASNITECEFCLDHDIMGWLDVMAKETPGSAEQAEAMNTINMLLEIKGTAR